MDASAPAGTPPPATTPRVPATGRRLVAWPLLLLICLAQAGLGARWMSRNGFFDRPMTSDAAHYRIDTLRMKRAYEEGGLGAWLGSGLTYGRGQPPATQLLAALIAALRKDDGVAPSSAWAAVQVFGALLVVGTYRLARNFGGRGAALAAAALAASTPVVEANLRPFFPQFPMAATLVWVYDAALRCRGFTRRGATAALGVWCATACLTKVLAPLYFAGPVGAAFLVGVARPATRRAALRNAGIALAALGLAVPWYVSHWDNLWSYVGYVVGPTGQALFSGSVEKSAWERWIYYPFNFANNGIGAFFAATLLALAFARLCGGAPRSDVPETERAPRGSAWLLAAAPLVAYIPLTLGQTAARAFYTLPFVPLAALAAARLTVALRSTPARRAAITVLALVAVFHQVLGQEDFVDVTKARGELRVATFGRAAAGLTFDLAPHVDLFLTWPASMSGVMPGGPVEAWPTRAFVARILATSEAPEPFVAKVAIPGFVHPYVETANLVYEAELVGRRLRCAVVDDPAVGKERALAELAKFEFVVVDERPHLGSTKAEALAEALRAGGRAVEIMESVVVTPRCRVALLRLTDPLTIEGPRPLEDLGAPGVVRVRAAFESGWTLLGVRATTTPDGAPHVVAWFDDAGRGAEDVDAVVFGVVATRPEVHGYAKLRASDAPADPSRPLRAVTFRGLAPTPSGTPPELHLRLKFARPERGGAYAVVAETDLPRIGPNAVLLPAPSAAGAASRPAGG